MHLGLKLAPLGWKKLSVMVLGAGLGGEGYREFEGIFRGAFRKEYMA